MKENECVTWKKTHEESNKHLYFLVEVKRTL